MELNSIGSTEYEELNTEHKPTPPPQPVMPQQVVETPPAPVQTKQTAVPQMFAPTMTFGEAPKGVDKATEKADEIVSEVFGQAVVHTIARRRC